MYLSSNHPDVIMRPKYSRYQLIEKHSIVAGLQTKQCCPLLQVILHTLHDHLLTYLFTELNPSWGAVNCAAPQEPPSISWNPKAQYHVQKSPPLVPILSHINPIHSIPSYLSKIHFNIVHPPTSWFSQWSLSFWLTWSLNFVIGCRCKINIITTPV
jgi:hypothetical protein